VDTTFDTMGGPNDSVRTIVLQPDGRIVIGGDFTAVATSSRAHVARLTASGAVDLAFSPEAGTDDSLLAVARLSNGMLVTGGGFTSANGNPRQSIARFAGIDAKFTGIRMQSNGIPRITLTGQPGFGYVLEASSDVQNWGVIATGLMYGTVILQDTQAVNFP